LTNKRRLKIYLHSSELPKSLDHFINSRTFLAYLIPAFPYQILNLIFDMFRKFRPKILFSEFSLNIMEG